MAFNSNNPPASSSQPPGSLFGPSTNSSGGLFGNKNTAFSFGSQGSTAASSAGEQKPLFGATTDNKPANNPFAAASGGSGSATTAAGFGFPQTATSGPPPAPSFGTPKTTPSTQTPFGSTTPAPSSAQPQFAFGNPSTTPAGPPPSASTFGASTGATGGGGGGGGGGGLFGALNKPAEANSSLTKFSFGKPSESNTSASSSGSQPQSAGSLFGGAQPASGSSAGTGFNFGPKSADKPAEPAQPPSAKEAKPTFTFPSLSSTSSAAMTAPTSSAAAPPLFGAAPVSSQPASAQTSGLNLFGAASSTSAPSAAPKPAFSFPSASPQPTASSAPPAAPEAPKPLFAGLGGGASAAPSISNPFGKAPATTAPSSSTAPTTTAPATTSSFAGLGSTTITAPCTGTAVDPKLAASTSGPIPPAQSRLKNKTMDEILTRWATDLTKYTKDFKNHAETVAKWDQTIVDNSSKIDKLYVKTRTCEKQTMSVEMQLSAVESQQAELESWLSKYENEVDEMLAKENANPAELGGPDQERERTYKLAERLQERLDDMGRDLESMVEEVNAANASLSKNGKADEPITQIVRILNTHLSQLQAIDQGTATLQKKVAEAQKSASGIGYLNGSNNEAKAAVDDFYRSYMGRR